MPVPTTPRFDRLLALGVIGLALLVHALREPVHPWRDALLLAVAVSPWIAKALTRWQIPTWLFALPTLAGVGALLGSGGEHESSPLLLLILVVSAGFRAPLWESLTVNALACGLILGAAWRADHVEDALIWGVGITLGWAFGHSSRCQVIALQRLEAAQETLAQTAAADERRRVAREVHDVIAHTLAVTMLHLTGARLALAEGDTDEALRGMQDAERLGRDSLAGLRRSVGLLTTSESAVTPPAPGAGDLRQLVAQYRAAGAEVELTMSGSPDALPAAVGLAVFRVAQESLANAVRHAPGSRIRVVLDARDPLRLVVIDQGGAAAAPGQEGSGVGIPGMRERAAQLGGTLEAGPVDRGWRVELVAPLRVTVTALPVG